MCFEYQLEAFPSEMSAFEHELDMSPQDKSESESELSAQHDAGSDPWDKVLEQAYGRAHGKRVSSILERHLVTSTSSEDDTSSRHEHKHGYPHAVKRNPSSLTEQLWPRRTENVPVLQRIMVAYNKTEEQAKVMKDYYEFWNEWGDKKSTPQLTIQEEAEKQVPTQDVSDFKLRLSSMLGKPCLYQGCVSHIWVTLHWS